MSASGAGSYEIARPTRRCAATGRELQVGERFIAALVRDPEADAFLRHDYAPEAWDSGARPALQLVASWRSTVPEPTARRGPFIGEDELMDVFEQLEAATEPSAITFRYMIALMLVRKRRLVYEGAGPGVMKVRVKVPAAQEQPPIIEVVDPQLDEERVAEAIEQVGRIIAGDEDGENA